MRLRAACRKAQGLGKVHKAAQGAARDINRKVKVLNGPKSLAEANEQASRRALDRARAETATRLDVHVAVARLEAARASDAVGRDAVAQALESRLIIRDRYEAGLTDVASLLRATEAVVQAEAQQVAAQVGVLTEAAALERAVGRQ